MPLPGGATYRWKTTKSGKKVRLAFSLRNKKVIEVKKKNGQPKLTSAGRKLMRAL